MRASLPDPSADTSRHSRLRAGACALSPSPEVRGRHRPSVASPIHAKRASAGASPGLGDQQLTGFSSVSRDGCTQSNRPEASWLSRRRSSRRIAGTSPQCASSLDMPLPILDRVAAFRLTKPLATRFSPEQIAAPVTRWHISPHRGKSSDCGGQEMGISGDETCPSGGARVRRRRRGERRNA